ncbi:MAG: hypothetical protein AB1649_19965 [Chloroflexota bacterium]
MSEDSINEIVEDALQTWPVAEVPQGFSRRVLQRIEAAPQPKIKFQFTWLDYALGLFTVSMPVLALLVWALLPDLFILRMTYRALLLWNSPQYQLAWGYTLFGIAGLLTFVLLAGILFAYTSAMNRKLAVSP